MMKNVVYYVNLVYYVTFSSFYFSSPLSSAKDRFFCSANRCHQVIAGTVNLSRVERDRIDSLRLDYR